MGRSAIVRSVLALSVVAVGLSVAGVSPSAGAAEPPRMSVTAVPSAVTSSSGSFGSLALGDTASKVFTVKNLAASTVPFTLAIGGSGPYVIVPSGTTCAGSLAAGKSCQATVSFQPTAVGSFPGALLVLADGTGLEPAGTQLASGSLAGSGIAPYGVSPSSSASQFGNWAIGSTSPSKTFTITNRHASGGPARTVSDVATTNADFVVTGGTCGVGVAVPSKGTCTVAVAFVPTSAGLASVTGQLRVEFASEVPATVNLVGQKTRSVLLSPSPVVFGTVVVATPSTKTVTVTSRTSFEVGLAVPTVSPAGPYSVSATTCGATLAAGATCTVDVTFTPTAVGSRTAKLSLPVVDAVSGAYTSTVNLSGTGGLSKPGAPTIGTATAGDASATVTWTAPVSNGGSAITGYTVVVLVGGSQTTTVSFAAGDTSGVVTGLTNGTTYTFEVYATNAQGDGPSSAESNPVTPSAPNPNLVDATQVALGDVHACAVVAGGQVRCWGDNSFGQLGNGTLTSSTTPVLVSGITGATQVATGDLHSCALVTGGEVRCWGENGYGQLGDGTTSSSSTPVAVSGVTGATQIAGGYSHTCAVIGFGDVRCWGNNDFGQLGDGTTVSSPTPVTVTGNSGVVDLAVGAYHSCGVMAPFGEVRCWGSNSYGQLGDGTFTNSSTPVRASGVFGASEVVIGDRHSCAVEPGFAVRCWGSNDSGQLGDGTTVSSPTPVTVTGLTGAPQLAGGGYHTCALVTGGEVCWGNNSFGQLGDGSTTNSSTPVAVSGLTGATQIESGGLHSCAVVAGGEVRCWGYNAFGQVGDGTLTDTSTPVAVLAGP